MTVGVGTTKGVCSILPVAVLRLINSPEMNADQARKAGLGLGLGPAIIGSPRISPCPMYIYRAFKGRPSSQRWYRSQDNDGDISEEEFKAFYAKNQEFQSL